MAKKDLRIGDELLGHGNGLGRDVLGVFKVQGQGTPLDAAGGVDFLEGEVKALLPGQPVHLGLGTGEGPPTPMVTGSLLCAKTRLEGIKRRAAKASPAKCLLNICFSIEKDESNLSLRIRNVNRLDQV